ncbi:response regulator (plasmid) [Rhizobium sp. CB3171]|uniref:response regulator n=1 Tax=unclassified Rhizobium TaxID=2613769 RepID=UPI0024B06B7A|nr:MULTISPECIES: response regulator [unclassified Rhizobium]MDK4740287.1 response regulator [Rhizobium sp. CNPSo 3464]WFU05671.1 response regulator [Rhizobium sp. CB3171]
MREREREREDVRGNLVLIVEDEFFIAMELREALIEGGFRVLGPVGSVEDALDLLQDERPDAAVLDVNLDDEKVTPVAILLKSLGVPFVLASACEKSELAQNAILANAVNVGKPTDMKGLLGVIQALTM